MKRQLHSWLTDLRRTGWLRARSRGDLQAARKMLADTFNLLQKLPEVGVPLPVFAALNLGDAHALDPDRDLGRLVCRALASMQDLPAPRKKSEWRRNWEWAGVVPDELSVTVLSLNLPAMGDSLTDCVLRGHAEAGEPCRLTFRQLRLHPPTIASAVVPGAGECKVYVCENSSVVASAAERLGANCRPLICVEGQPNLASIKLLRAVTSSNRQLAYHGDFDWGGIRIANRIHREFGFEPWRFDAANYNDSPEKQRKLREATAEAVWDRDLSDAMLADGHALEEEQVLEELLTDLDERLAR